MKPSQLIKIFNTSKKNLKLLLPSNNFEGGKKELGWD